MTDAMQAPQAPPAAQAPPPAPAGPALTPADHAAIAAQIAPLLAGSAAAAAPAPAEPENLPSPVNLFEKGQLVSHTYTTPYDGTVTRYGMVVDTLPDEGAGARSIVAWFEHVSGPLGDQLLAAG